jgi:hypothetical protein
MAVRPNKSGASGGGGKGSSTSKGAPAAKGSPAKGRPAVDPQRLLPFASPDGGDGDDDAAAPAEPD